MRKNRILEMCPGELHEVDGVVFDADSYARYLQHYGTAGSPPQEPPDDEIEGQIGRAHV